MSLITPIYLDHAAATPIDPRVLTTMQPYFSGEFYNPSALYAGARTAKQALEEARMRSAQVIGCRPSEVVFTAGGTESANLAIRGIADMYPGSEIIISAVEHDAVREPSRLYGALECPVDTHGMIRLDTLEKMITDNTVLVSVMYANNEVGTVQPLSDIAAMVADIRNDRKKRGITLPLLVHTDACQAPLYLDCNVARLHVDVMTLNGGKLYGPKQSGVLYIRAGVQIKPQILGGGQEWGVRSGTENVAAAVGFSYALQQAQEKHKNTAYEMQKLTHEFRNQLIERFGATQNGHAKKRLPNNVHVTFAGADNERVLFALDDLGVYAAAGSACSASSQEVSHVLTAMGVSEADARASIRFSFGRSNTQADIPEVLAALEKALKA